MYRQSAKKLVKQQYLLHMSRCKVHFASKSCVLLHWQHYCTALEQQASAKLCTRNEITELSLLVIFNRGRHLYSEGGHHLQQSPHSSCVFVGHAVTEIDEFWQKISRRGVYRTE